MQLGNVTTDPAKDYGITFARRQYTDPLPADHPHKGMTDFDYFVMRISDLPDNWARQADLAAVVPPPSTDPGTPSADWRPQANTDLAVKRAAILGILTTMQTSYSAKGLTENAAACQTVKDGLLTIEQTLAVAAVYMDPAGTRAQFDAAMKTAWLTLVAPAPTAVKADYPKYGGSSL